MVVSITAFKSETLTSLQLQIDTTTKLTSMRLLEAVSSGRTTFRPHEVLATVSDPSHGARVITLAPQKKLHTVPVDLILKSGSCWIIGSLDKST